MTPAEALAQVAERYRMEGYDFTPDPMADDLPEPLRRGYPAAVARRNGRHVFIEVWERGQVHDLPPQPMPPGWSYDAIMLPRPEHHATIGPAPTAEFAQRLLTELDECLPRAAVRARFLLAWSAVESALRVAAKRFGYDPSGAGTSQILGELVFEGVISNEQADQLTKRLQTRNRLGHGYPADDLEPHHADDMARIARELLAEQPVSAA